MNATDVLQTEPAAMHSRDAAGDNAPCARAGGRHMMIRHLGMAAGSVCRTSVAFI